MVSLGLKLHRFELADTFWGRHWPIGVLYDLFIGRDPSDTRDDENEEYRLPWNLTLHLENFPTKHLMRAGTPQAFQEAWSNCLKEVSIPPIFHSASDALRPWHKCISPPVSRSWLMGLLNFYLFIPSTKEEIKTNGTRDTGFYLRPRPVLCLPIPTFGARKSRMAAARLSASKKLRH
jgi:hypothetical protein